MDEKIKLIWDSAWASNKKLYETYPAGCDEDQARELFASEPYPTIAWEVLTKTDSEVEEAIKNLINENV